MSLSYEERAVRVAHLSDAFERSPSRYSLRVIAWILLGYAIVGSIIAIAVGIAVTLFSLIAISRMWILLKVAWIPAVFAWMLLRSIYVRIDAPKGRALTRREAPRLFAMIDEIRTALGVPKLASVLLIDEPNAAVTETPRLGGIFGWRSHLLIGAPILLTMSTDEFRAVLAHELGHLSRRDNRLSGWTYRLRETWGRVLGGLALRDDFVARRIKRVMEAYVDHFLLVTLVQARNQELAADRAAAELTSPAIAASALAWVSIIEKLLDTRLWDPLVARMAEEEAPSIAPHEDFLRRRAELLAPPHDELLSAVLARPTPTDATHPSLADRLQHIGAAVPMLVPAPQCAGNELLPRTFATLIQELDRDWRVRVLPMWRERHSFLDQTRETLARLDALDPQSSEPGDLLDRADALEQLGHDDEAFDLCAAVVHRVPLDARATFAYGRRLVERGDLAGLSYLRTAMEKDWSAIAPACELAYNALRERGMEAEAEEWIVRYRAQSELLARAHDEKTTLRKTDDLHPHDIPPSRITEILARCYDAGWVRTVWIVRKEIRTLPQTVYVVAVRPKLFRRASQLKIQALLNDLQLSEPFWLFVIYDGSLIRRLNRAMRGTSMSDIRKILRA